MANNSNKKWKPEEKKKLIELAEGNTPTRIIALKLGRSESSIRSKAQKEKISLKPTNQSPYDRKYSISKRKKRSNFFKIPS